MHAACIEILFQLATSQLEKVHAAALRAAGSNARNHSDTPALRLLSLFIPRLYIKSTHGSAKEPLTNGAFACLFPDTCSKTISHNLAILHCIARQSLLEGVLAYLWECRKSSFFLPRSRAAARVHRHGLQGVWIPRQKLSCQCIASLHHADFWDEYQHT